MNNIKRVYTFGNGKAEGRADMRNELGGKGANLAEMNLIGVPVPPGFTITTDVCNEYYKRLGLTLRVLGKYGYAYYLSMTSNSGFLEDGVCAVLFVDDILL